MIYDEPMYDDTHCFHCSARLPEDPDYSKLKGDEPEFDGFCSEACRADSFHKKPHLPCIRPIFDMLSHDLGENPDAWSKAIYKGTECGAWLRIVDATTINVGSIVEGSDAEFQTTLEWPFTKDEFWEAVSEINRQAIDAWEEAHAEDPDDETYNRILRQLLDERPASAWLEFDNVRESLGEILHDRILEAYRKEQEGQS